MLSGLEIQERLRAFVTRWRGYAGSEIAEDRTFLDELFAAYGTDRKAVGALFQDFKASTGFMDLHWPGVLIVEMKRPGRPLRDAAEQRERYWRESEDEQAGIPAARWVIACNFQEFEIWEPGRFPKSPRASFSIDELVDRYDALLFLQSASTEPVFAEHRRALTVDAARHIAELYLSLEDRGAAPVEEIRLFTMQVVWTLFAEDLGMLDGYPLQATINELLDQPHPDSARDLGWLFKLLNQKGDQNRQGKYAGTRYVNGDLFAHPAEVQLTKDELRHLKDAAEFDWRTVDPTIFGALMEGVLGDDRRSHLGAHYTHEADIMKIVVPTIVRPWRERIDAVQNASQARSLLDELCAFRVLDPACGSGNFLYVAYRELRGLERELKDRIVALAKDAGEPVPSLEGIYYPLSGMHGIEIEGIAQLIARVTLWMGHRQMVDRYGPAEPVLPLVRLDRIVQADALRVAWPEVDAIIGNPPFLGSQLLRKSLGDDYVEWLRGAFGVGVKDLCVYWFRKTQDLLKPGQRAGLVGSNSVSQNRARSASLDYIVATGGVITDAVSSQKWPGEAKVHVSIVNWIKQPSDPPAEFDLDGRSAIGISASLRPELETAWKPGVLAANSGRCFQGPRPVGKGFVISEGFARQMLSDEGSDYSRVVRPYLSSDDIANGRTQDPSRWAIDFGLDSLERARDHPLALDHLRATVKDARGKSSSSAPWWQFDAPRKEMRDAIEPLSRYVVNGRHGKRMLAVWAHKRTLAMDATNVFAFDDDYSMGILMSRAHDAWAWAQSSTLKGDLRYTPTTVFGTFPWPDPVTPEQRKRIAEACRALYARRSALCIEHGIGLTKLYNLMDDGGFADLKALHRELDVAVAAAYGWPASVAQDPDELVARLTERNREIVEGERPYSPFA